MTITGGAPSGNMGGGLLVRPATLGDITVEGSSFEGNTAAGGLYVASSDTARCGGGVYTDCTTTCTGDASSPSSVYGDVGHLGEGADDNVAGHGVDLYMSDVGELSYGDAATFTCTDTECR